MTEDVLHPPPAQESSPTAADAAVLQLAEGDSSKQPGELVRHPAAALYDAIFEAVLPVVAILSQRKNVPLAEDDHPALLRFALEAVPRKTMRRAVAGEPVANSAVVMAVDHAFDILAAMRMMQVMLQIEKREPPPGDGLRQMAEEAVAQIRNSANDRAPSIHLWGDPIQAALNYCNHLAEDAALPPMLTLPQDATVKCMVRKPRRGKKAGDD